MIRLTEQQATQLMIFLSDQPIPQDNPLIAILDSLDRQLKNPSHEQHVVDRIAEILMTPPPGGSLSQSRVASLRKALFSPRDLHIFNETPVTIQCASCGVTIADQELISAEGSNIYCYRCQVPAFVSCTTCRTFQVPLHEALRRTIAREMKGSHVCEGPPTRPGRAGNSGDVVNLPPTAPNTGNAWDTFATTMNTLSGRDNASPSIRRPSPWRRNPPVAPPPDNEVDEILSDLVIEDSDEDSNSEDDSE